VPGRKYGDEFRREALERMKTADNITALARELGIRRKWLYQWRDDALKAAGLSKVPQTRPKRRSQTVYRSKSSNCCDWSASRRQNWIFSKVPCGE
jgi:transposase-like protein